MQWADFYDGFWDWSDSTRRTKISALEDIGPGDEIVEIVLEMEDETLRSQLIRKAMALGVRFTADDFMSLDEALPDKLYEQLGKYAGYDHNDPYFDEETMTWDDFCNGYFHWDDAILARRIEKIRHWGPADEVVDMILDMPKEMGVRLFNKAKASGIRFTRDTLMELGMPLDSAPEESVVPKEESPHISLLDAIIGTIFAGTNPHDTGLCNGDCSNCPAHYGYRYGRWYYGHGHQHGCQRSGNGGATGKTYRD